MYCFFFFTQRDALEHLLQREETCSWVLYIMHNLFGWFYPAGVVEVFEQRKNFDGARILARWCKNIF